MDNHITNLKTTESTPFLASDHFIITFEVHTSVYSHKSTTRYVFNYSKGNYEELNDYLLDVDFSSFEEDNINVEDMWLQLKAKILNACTLYIPKVKLTAY